MGDHVVTILRSARSLEVNDDRVHDEQREAGEEVEAEENDVRGRGRAERKGQDVHPRNNGRPVREEEQEYCGEDRGVGKELVLECNIEEDDDKDEEQVGGQVPDEGGEPVGQLAHP